MSKKKQVGGADPAILVLLFIVILAGGVGIAYAVNDDFQAWVDGLGSDSGSGASVSPPCTSPPCSPAPVARTRTGGSGNKGGVIACDGADGVSSTECSSTCMKDKIAKGDTTCTIGGQSIRLDGSKGNKKTGLSPGGATCISNTRKLIDLTQLTELPDVRSESPRVAIGTDGNAVDVTTYAKNIRDMGTTPGSSPVYACRKMCGCGDETNQLRYLNYGKDYEWTNTKKSRDGISFLAKKVGTSCVSDITAPGTRSILKPFDWNSVVQNFSYIDYGTGKPVYPPKSKAAQFIPSYQHIAGDFQDTQSCPPNPKPGSPIPIDASKSSSGNGGGDPEVGRCVCNHNIPSDHQECKAYNESKCRPPTSARGLLMQASLGVGLIS